jgi:hypothetical protein
MTIFQMERDTRATQEASLIPLLTPAGSSQLKPAPFPESNPLNSGVYIFTSGAYLPERRPLSTTTLPDFSPKGALVD